MSDDYLNFISSVNSSTTEKFSSGIQDYSIYHFRPLWFLSMELSIYLNGLFNPVYDNFVFFRAENLILFFILAALSAGFVFRVSGNYFYALMTFVFIIVFPNNNLSIFWTTGKVDILCGIFVISALRLSLEYSIKRQFMYLILPLLFFLLALFTKETSVVLPLLCLIILKLVCKKDSGLKMILITQILMLIFYFTYRLFLLRGKASGVFNIYMNPDPVNYLLIIIKALISLIIPLDYLSLLNGFSEKDAVVILLVLVSGMFFIYLFFKLLKIKKRSSLISLASIFLIIIIPNMTAGYFRPQLIMIPFIFIIISAFILLSEYNIRISVLAAVIICMLFLGLNIVNIKDWNFGYKVLRESVNRLLAAGLNSQEPNYIIGLPSRYKTVYMDDYITGAYNFYKNKNFIVNDRSLVDFIHSGALDKSSLNAGLIVRDKTEDEFIIETKGNSQYLMKLDIVANTFKDENTELIFSDFNLFGKPKTAHIKILKDKAKVFIYDGDKIKLYESNETQQ